MRTAFRGLRGLGYWGVVGAISLAATACASSPPPPPSSTVVPSPSTVTPHLPAPHIVATYALPDTRGSAAMAAGEGSLWVASQGGPTPGPTNGELFQINPTTGQAVRSWPVGNDPVALAVMGSSVWVANSTGGESAPDPDANSILQFAVDGAGLINHYSVPGLQGIVAAVTNPWVVAQPPGQDSTDVIRLTSTALTHLATLPGIPSAGITWEGAAACGGSVYVASVLDTQGSDVHIARLLTGGTAAATWTFGPGTAALTCAGTEAVAAVANPESGGFHLLSGSESSATSPFGPRTASSIVSLGAQIWAVVPGVSFSYVTAFDYKTREPAPGVGQTMRVGDARLITAAGGYLWVASSTELYKIEP